MVLRGEQEPLAPGRLEGLAEFQRSCVLKAMSVPSIVRVVYSTCSIYEEENENVVRAVLAANPSFRLASREEVLPKWKKRGDGEGMEGCIRVDPKQHGTIGFFVAVFDKKKKKKKKKKNKNKNKNAVEDLTKKRAREEDDDDEDPNKKATDKHKK
jgi:putative methyltransferase